MNNIIKINGKTWKQDILLYNISYIATTNDLFECLKNYKPFFTSRCSKTKTGNEFAIPKEFYISNVNKIFYRCMEKYNLYYGILSDKYGIHFADEKLKYYDTHPSCLSLQDKQDLGRQISKKLKNIEHDSIVFYNPSPCMSVPYFEMLNFANEKIFYITKIKIIYEFMEKKYNGKEYSS